MAEEAHSPPLDWLGVVVPAARQGRLMDLLVTMPRDCWTQRDYEGRTLLHYASRCDVAAAVALIAAGIDVNACDAHKRTAAVEAALNAQPRVVEVLIAAGSMLRTVAKHADAPLDAALRKLPRTAECARVLLANGVRLSSVGENQRNMVTHELVAFERGVLRCRVAVVVILGLKRRRGVVLRALDRWVVRELCFSLWCTRAARAWQQEVAPKPHHHPCALQ